MNTLRYYSCLNNKHRGESTSEINFRKFVYFYERLPVYRLRTIKNIPKSEVFFSLFIY